MAKASSRVQDALIAALQGETTPLSISVETYYKMAELGLLNPETGYELIDGIILEMQPMSPEHAYRVKWLSDKLMACCQNEAVVLTTASYRGGSAATGALRASPSAARGYSADC